MRANKALLHGDITASITPYGRPQKRRASIASSSKPVQATKPAVPVVAVALPFQSTVQLPFPENGASRLSTWVPPV